MSGCGNENAAYAIESVQEIHQGRNASQDTAEDPGYVRVFRVVANHSTVSAREVRAATGIPSIGDAYSVASAIGGAVTDTNARVSNVVATQPDPDSQELWHVVVTYSAETYPPGLTPSARWRTSRFSRVLETEVDNGQSGSGLGSGRPVANSAGDPPSPLPEVDDNRPEYVREFWTTAWSEDLFLAYRNAVNDAPVTIGDKTFPARTLKITGIDSERHERGATFYWRVSLSVEYNPDGWLVEFYDRGFRELRDDYYSGGTCLVEIPDKNGVQPTEPYYLDGAGAKLVEGNDPVTLEFAGYPEADFSILNLDHSGD